MTLEEARQSSWLFSQNKATVERVDIHQQPDASYSVHVVRMDGSEETFIDPVKAAFAAVHQQTKESREADLYATLDHPNGVPVLCDRQTYLAWHFKDSESLRKRIACSADILATITFTGHSPASVSMDGPRFWSLSFYSLALNEHYGCGPENFETREQAEACLTHYVNSDCPAPHTPEWWKAHTSFKP